MTEDEAWDELERKQQKKPKPVTEREALKIAYNALVEIDRETPYPLAKHAAMVINSVLNVSATDWEAIAADQAMTIAMSRIDDDDIQEYKKPSGIRKGTRRVSMMSERRVRSCVRLKLVRLLICAPQLSEQGETSMTDKELLEYAAKAAGIDERRLPDAWPNRFDENQWDPLIDDGDALRLAVKLGINIHNSAHSPSGIPFVYAQKLGYRPCQEYGDDEYAATRRAIVRAAAEIGRQA